MSSPELAAVRGTSVPVAVRYDDLGSTGHVDNVASMRIIEEARHTFLGHPVTPRAPGGLLDLVPSHIQHLVHRQDIEYRDELWYQAEPFLVDVWVSAVGTTSFRLGSAIRTSADAEPAVTAEAVIVLVDLETGKPWPIPCEIGGQFTGSVIPR
ncbi:acyl-CoA thioesterase [Rhodococcus aetherivorans]|uniref:acyl-CoA thioesterase n=1 Tax=Rhodococcus aetherivorans TaxID=191292 RepID=UPI003689F1E3